MRPGPVSTAGWEPALARALAGHRHLALSPSSASVAVRVASIPAIAVRYREMWFIAVADVTDLYEEFGDNRPPPGQRRTDRFPVLSKGDLPDVDFDEPRPTRS